MFYRPNFCCNCGEKIQRAEWKLTASRRFCDVCEVENKGHEWLMRSVVGLSLVAGIFGFGTYMSTSGRNDQIVPTRAEQSADDRRNSAVPSSRPQRLVAETGQAPPISSSIEGPAAADLSNLAVGSARKEQLKPQNSASDEPVYFCGAMTKKGKPCSRRVKIKGRCWQHIGQPSAMEPRQPADVY